MIEKGINWNNLETAKKRGSCCIKEKYTFTNQHGEITERTQWEIDNEIPIFSQDRGYIENLILIDD